eukprot:10411566-Ditylum_brightwellii.AAC.1
MPLITEAMSGYHHVEAASRLTEILTHVFSTLIIASICYACAVAAPGVAVSEITGTYRSAIEK